MSSVETAGTSLIDFVRWKWKMDKSRQQTGAREKTHYWESVWGGGWVGTQWSRKDLSNDDVGRDLDDAVYAVSAVVTNVPPSSERTVRTTSHRTDCCSKLRLFIPRIVTQLLQMTATECSLVIIWYYNSSACLVPRLSVHQAVSCRIQALWHCADSTSMYTVYCIPNAVDKLDL